MKTIYHKLKRRDHYLIDPLSPIENALADPEAVYLFDRLDDAVRGIPFSDCLPEEHLNHLRGTPGTSLMINFCDDYFNMTVLSDIIKHIVDWEIPQEKITWVVKDNLFGRFVREAFAKEDMRVEIIVYGPLQSRVRHFPEFDIQETNFKFSCFSRNYLYERLALFSELIDRDLLKEFTYSFWNINPYDIAFSKDPDPKNGTENMAQEHRVYTYSYKDLFASAEQYGIRLSATGKRWVMKVPHVLDDGSVKSAMKKWSDVTSAATANSDFHVLIESHFNPWKNFEGEEGKWTIQEFSPAFPTEKTYKAIMSCRPFIAYACPYFLVEMRELGFKTFGEYINEDYDLIVDNNRRRTAIIDEIDRLNKLPKERYDTIRRECFKIAQTNKAILIAQNRGYMQNWTQSEFGEHFIDFSDYSAAWDESKYKDDDYLNERNI